MVVVWQLDRLGRVVNGPVDFAESLHVREVHFKSLTNSIDTGIFHLLAVFGQNRDD